MARTTGIFHFPEQLRALRAALARCCVALTLAFLVSCSSWHEVRRFDRWTLYETANAPLEIEVWEDTFEPAIDAVETHFGPFKRPVAVHAWSGSVGIDGQRHTVLTGDEDAAEPIPGISDARIQAWHARDNGFGNRGGIFISEPEVGTAVHELVHAYYSDKKIRLPLWFEEGVATLIGDGAMWNGEWVVDGLAYWPLRELRKQALSDEELETLLNVRAGQPSSVAENVSVHFIGWAIVFDLFVETGSLDWEVWFERFDFENQVQDARRRLQRTLQAETEEQWLERLASKLPGRRLATARGVWKVRTDQIANILLNALETEEVPEIRTSLALNLLAGTARSRQSRRIRDRARRLISAVFHDVRLSDPREQQAMQTLYDAYLGSRHEDVSAALEELTAYWSE